MIDLSLFKDLVIQLARWMDSLVKGILIPLLERVGMSDSTAGVVVTLVELIVLLTVISKISGALRWILVAVLALLILGALLPG